jgi:predicted ferric reductase
MREVRARVGGDVAQDLAPLRTVASPPTSARHRGGSVRLALLGGALLVIGLWWQDTTTMAGPGGTVTAAGRLAGLIATYLVLVQILLMSRVPWFERAVGFDRLAAWHRGLGTNTVLLIVAHVVLISQGYGQAAHQNVAASGWHIVFNYPDMFQALAAVALFGLVAWVSARTMRARMSYEAWYWLHLSTYVAIALSFEHQITTGADFVGHSFNRLLWIALYAGVAGSVLVFRVGTPVRAWFVHRMVVDRVVVEGPGVVSVWIRGRRLDELGAQAGHFLLWRFVTPGHMWSAHPYSLSATPRDRHLRITVKAAGDHSRSLARLHHGTPVLAEGPFGHFTGDRRELPRTLLIAGGSGIGPVRALAEEFLASTRPPAGSVVLIYRASRPADLVLRHELDALTQQYGLVVHYLVGRRSDIGYDPLDARSLAKLVPDIRGRDCYVCGPPGMTHRVLSSLSRLKVAPRQVHAEEFAL